MFFDRKTTSGDDFEISVLKSLLGGVRLQVPKAPIQQVLVTGVEKGYSPKSPQNPFLVTQMTPPDSMNITRPFALMTLLVTRWSIFRKNTCKIPNRAVCPSNSDRPPHETVKKTAPPSKSALTQFLATLKPF